MDTINLIYIVTGASGHLGSALCRLLSQQGARVRGLILPGQKPESFPHVTYYEGDVRDPATLAPMFEDTRGREVIVIHSAGIIDISEHVTPAIHAVNVGGTANIIALCRQYAVRRLVYVSSVHAIPEKPNWQVMDEVDHFDPALVRGGYAKTKAEATQLVLDAAADGLDAVVVHPSGILGPYDTTGNHLVQMVNSYILGKLPACVHGGYDFVDVRDVAQGCVAAAEKGTRGACYILSNRHYEVRDVLNMVKAIHGGRKLPVLPTWMATLAEPFLQLDAKRKKERPLYTSYSLQTLVSNDKFSHDRATRELGYYPRDLYETLKDTVDWIQRNRQERHQRVKVAVRRGLRKKAVAVN